MSELDNPMLHPLPFEDEYEDEEDDNTNPDEAYERWRDEHD